MYYKQKTNCTPWDYPLPKDNKEPNLCTSYYDGTQQYNNSLHGFNAAMEDPETMKNCTEQCPPNCDEVTYSISSMDTTYLEVDQLCYEGEATRDVIPYDGLTTTLFTYNL